MRAAIVVALVAASLTARAQSCPSGQTVGPDTAGHCCWPQQAWSNARGTCVGVPACPGGFETRGESCVAGPECPAGQQMTEETHGHCCWLGQVWSTSRGLCIGIPMCPANLRVSGETCVTTQATPPTPAPAPVPTPTPTPTPAPMPTPGMQSTPSVAPPPPASLPKFAIRFEPRASQDVFRISADGRSCTTPCTLDLPPGDLQVHVDAGARALDSALKVPGSASTVAVSYPSRASYAVGGALLALGLADTAVGIYFAAAGGFNGHEAVGAVNIVLGTAAAIVGIVNLASAGRARLELRSSSVAQLFGGGAR
jgi:hypothetical protein